MKYLKKVALIFSLILLLVGSAFTAVGLLLGASPADSDMLRRLENLAQENKGFVITTERLRNKMEKELVQDENGEKDLIPEENHFLSRDDRKYETHVPDNFEIILSADALYLKAYDQDQITIQVDDDFDEQVKVSSSEDTLRLESERKIHDGQITVYYPAKMDLKLLKVTLDAGRVEIMDDFQTDEMDITIGAGELDSDGSLMANKAIIEVGAGKVEIEKLGSNLLCGKCGVGSMSVTMEGKETDYNYYLECGLGKIQLGENSHSSMADQAEISDNHSGKRLELSCGLGEIDISFTEQQ